MVRLARAALLLLAAAELAAGEPARLSQAVGGSAAALSTTAGVPVSATAADSLSRTASVPLSSTAAVGNTVTAASVSPTGALADLPLLPARPKPLKREKNIPWQDFTVTTLISLPFTMLWCALGAYVVGSISQARFPPNITTPMIAGAAGLAGAASVTIGLVSVSWGTKGSPDAAGPVPLRTPVPTPTRIP